ncbi:MAG: type II toxin-antitoxin system HicA family toxin [Chloroflexota bacterium]
MPFKIVERDGWFVTTQKGSHRQFKHPVKQGKVTIAAIRAKMCRQ